MFFEFSYPTKERRTLLTQVCYRLSGDPRQVSSIFRLHTSFGGGKTHGLIALVHAVSSGTNVPNIAEFVDPAILPKGVVKVAGFEGENADALNGHAFPEYGIKAYTPWGELAIALAGKDGYDRVRESDEKGSPPGADTIRELIGDGPCLILVDELAVYLRRARKKWPDIDESLASFLTSLFKAVESSPQAAIVFTLALGKNSSQSIDAYGKESETIASFFFEADSTRPAGVPHRSGGCDETVKVLRRRLFASSLTQGLCVMMPTDCMGTPHSDCYRMKVPRYGRSNRASYPLHPELMFVLTRKLSTLRLFSVLRYAAPACQDGSLTQEERAG
jgi:predicted AAA+ superfamily ATPase